MLASSTFCVSNADSRHAGCLDHCKARLRLDEPPALLPPPFAPPVVDERCVPAGRAVGVVDAMLPARPSCNWRWCPAPPGCASGRCFELGGELSFSSSCTSSSPSQPSCRNLSHWQYRAYIERRPRQTYAATKVSFLAPSWSRRNLRVVVARGVDRVANFYAPRSSAHDKGEVTKNACHQPDHQEDVFVGADSKETEEGCS